MSHRPLKIVAFLIIIPLAIATWILSSMTLGEQISPGADFVIGMAVAMLVVATSVSLLLLKTRPNARLAFTLVICGAVCIVMALALQFYLASVAAEIDRRAADILAQNSHRQSFHFNWNRTQQSASVIAIGYFAFFAGIWMVATGIRIGVGSSPSEEEDALFDMPARERVIVRDQKPTE